MIVLRNIFCRTATATQRLAYGLGLLCVAIAICIITGTIYTYFNSVLPLLVNDESIAWYPVLTLFTWLAGNLIFNYCMVVSTKPGKASVDMMREEDVQLAYEHRDDPSVKGLWCRKCVAPRPFRAHHCPLCGYCVLKMDHHCPWINQCVGHYNHKYFVLFLVYLWLSVVTATVTISLNYFGVLVNKGRSGPKLRSAMDEVVVCFSVCTALTVVMFFFVVWTLHLVTTNQTSIEYLSNSTGHTQNIYNHHNRLKNLRTLFGASFSPFRMLLPSIQPPQDSGHVYEIYEGFSQSNDGVLVTGNL